MEEVSSTSSYVSLPLCLVPVAWLIACACHSMVVATWTQLLTKVPDLERALCRIQVMTSVWSPRRAHSDVPFGLQFGKAGPAEFCALCKSFKR